MIAKKVVKKSYPIMNVERIPKPKNKLDKAQKSGRTSIPIPKMGWIPKPTNKLWPLETMKKEKTMRKKTTDETKKVLPKKKIIGVRIAKK